MARRGIVDGKLSGERVGTLLGCSLPGLDLGWEGRVKCRMSYRVGTGVVLFGSVDSSLILK